MYAGKHAAARGGSGCTMPFTKMQDTRGSCLGCAHVLGSAWHARGSRPCVRLNEQPSGTHPAVAPALQCGTAKLLHHNVVPARIDSTAGVARGKKVQAQQRMLMQAPALQLTTSTSSIVARLVSEADCRQERAGNPRQNIKHHAVGNWKWPATQRLTGS